MPDERATVRRVAWREILPWLLLFRTIGVALALRKMFLAAVAILLTWAGWSILAYAFSGYAAQQSPLPVMVGAEPEGASVELPYVNTFSSRIEEYQRTPWSTDLPTSARLIPGIGGATSEDNPWTLQDCMVSPWLRLSAPVRQIFMDPDMTWVGLAFHASCALWALFVWALFGGMICRLAAVELTRDEKPSLGAAWAHVRPKLLAYIAAPLLPLVGVLLGIVFLSPLGLLLRLDVGSIVVGGLWCLVLVAGLVFAIFMVGLVFGWPLMWGAISVEGQDSWDALNRTYSYVYQRPLQFLFYVLVSGVVGLLGWMFVSLFATGVIYLGEWGVSWSSGGERMRIVEDAAPVSIRNYDWTAPTDLAAADAPSKPLRAGATMAAAWTAGARLLALGFGYSFFWTAATGIYLLLRKDTDDAPLDEIAIDAPSSPTLARTTISSNGEEGEVSPETASSSRGQNLANKPD
ncbi:MAG: hypothetical protein AB7O62_08885 [Pirellulales bacterium]